MCLLLVACTSTGDFDHPTVELVNIKALPPQGYEQRLQLTLRIQNPNRQAFTIEGLYSELSVQGKPFLNGVSNQGVEVPAYGEAMMELEASLSLMQSLSLFRDILMHPPSSGLEYELNSKLSIKNYAQAIRLKKQGTFNFNNLLQRSNP